MKKGEHQYLHRSLTAHVLRRTVHLASLLILWCYYRYGDTIANFFRISLKQLIGIALIVVLVLEAARLYRGWAIFGQRHYEKQHISAFAWGAVGMALVLLLAPEAQFAIPIIGAYAIGDPLLGELRRTRLAKIAVLLIGVVVVSGIWWLAYVYLGTPWWLILVMGPATVAAEWPCLAWIDDNALMQLIPLVIVLVVRLLPS